MNTTASDPTKITFEEFKGIYKEFLSQMPSALRKKNMAGVCRPCVPIFVLYLAIVLLCS